MILVQIHDNQGDMINASDSQCFLFCLNSLSVLTIYAVEYLYILIYKLLIPSLAFCHVKAVIFVYACTSSFYA